MTYFDISPPISAETAVFPGDTAFERRVMVDSTSGRHLEVSAMTTTVHVGAHADASSHYHEKGKPIESKDLNIYMGCAQVIRVHLKPGKRILPFHIKDEKIRASRVLFATGSYEDPTQWSGHFNSLSPELVEDLAVQGVRLVGIDTPSIDPAESKALESHQAVYAHDMSILEGLVLRDVPVGLYQLMALPLNLKGFDASPVRAILLPMTADLAAN